MELRNVLPRDISDTHSSPLPFKKCHYAHLILFLAVVLIPLESRQAKSIIESCLVSTSTLHLPLLMLHMKGLFIQR